ncbi:hypothetical protein H1C71_036314 [Ictidomys tridecemlineatus]|nr:hypothetical protein H1C71_036314 [Ictidomys tridecemlineatus]
MVQLCLELKAWKLSGEVLVLVHVQRLKTVEAEDCDPMVAAKTQEESKSQSSVLVSILLLPLLSPSGPSLLDGATHIQSRSCPLRSLDTCQSSLQTPSQMHPEVCFSSFLGVSQSSQDDSHS